MESNSKLHQHHFLPINPPLFHLNSSSSDNFEVGHILANSQDEIRTETGGNEKQFIGNLLIDDDDDEQNFNFNKDLHSQKYQIHNQNINQNQYQRQVNETHQLSEQDVVRLSPDNYKISNNQQIIYNYQQENVIKQDPVDKQNMLKYQQNLVRQDNGRVQTYDQRQEQQMWDQGRQKQPLYERLLKLGSGTLEYGQDEDPQIDGQNFTKKGYMPDDGFFNNQEFNQQSKLVNNRSGTMKIQRGHNYQQDMINDNTMSQNIENIQLQGLHLQEDIINNDSRSTKIYQNLGQLDYEFDHHSPRKSNYNRQSGPGKGDSSTTKGESIELNNCPFVNAEDTKSDYSESFINGPNSFNTAPFQSLGSVNQGNSTSYQNRQNQTGNSINISTKQQQRYSHNIGDIHSQEFNETKYRGLIAQDQFFQGINTQITINNNAMPLQNQYSRNSGPTQNPYFNQNNEQVIDRNHFGQAIRNMPQMFNQGIPNQQSDVGFLLSQLRLENQNQSMGVISPTQMPYNSGEYQNQINPVYSQFELNLNQQRSHQVISQKPQTFNYQNQLVNPQFIQQNQMSQYNMMPQQMISQQIPQRNQSFHQTGRNGMLPPTYPQQFMSQTHVIPTATQQQQQQFIPVNQVIQQNIMLQQQQNIYGRSSNLSQRSNASVLSGNQNSRPQMTQTSAFLEELKLRINSSKDITLQDLLGHFSECSLDQQCSRFIQQRLEVADDDEKQLLFNELLIDSQKLMKDVFGNYVLQKMLDYGNLNQRKMLYLQLKGNMMPLSKDQYGCRVVQKALEVLILQQQDDLINEIKPMVQVCVEDQHGNHVIQKIIEQVPSEKVQFIVDAFQQRVYEMSVHQYGCRVIQRMLEHCKEEQIRPIYREVFERVLDLTKDQYGNYVISHVLEHGAPQQKTFVINKMRKKVVQLSMHKNGSNVIEKCLQHADQNQRDELIDEIINVKLMDDAIPQKHQSSQQNCTLMDLMKDKFGNYVIQRVLEFCNDSQRKALIDKILQIATHMKKHKGHARHVFNYIEKNYKINIVFAEEEEKKGSKKSSGNERKSLNSNQTTQSLSLTLSKQGRNGKMSDANLGQSQNRMSSTSFSTNDNKSNSGNNNGQRKSKTKNKKKNINELNLVSQQSETSMGQKSNGDSMMEFDKGDQYA